VSSNSSLKSFFPDPLISTLGTLPVAEKEQANRKRYVVFQQPVSVLVGEQLWVLHGRTLEETFVYENLPYFQADAARIKIDFPDNLQEVFQAVYEHIGKRSFKKTEFALDLLSSDDEWETPKYISEGLQWLETKLNPPVHLENPAQ
jgi:putative ATP-dependent endonuclease of OLD family